MRRRVADKAVGDDTSVLRCG